MAAHHAARSAAGLDAASAALVGEFAAAAVLRLPDDSLDKVTWYKELEGKKAHPDCPAVPAQPALKKRWERRRKPGLLQPRLLLEVESMFQTVNPERQLRQ